MGLPSNGISDRSTLGKIALICFLLLAAVAIGYLAVKNIAMALVFSLVPLALYIFSVSLSSVEFSFLLLIVINYFLPLLSRRLAYSGINFTVGLITDALISFIIFVILVQIMGGNKNFRHIKAEPILVVLLWLGFCIFEGSNLGSSTEAWYKNIRNMALYFTAIQFVAQAAMKDFKSVRKFILIWAVLSLIAALYTFKQKFLGFSKLDNYFLYAQGAKTTHIIHSGIRYFSILSDAANMSGAMGVATTVFAIVGLSEDRAGYKVFYFITAAACALAMLYSGTRSALAVPFCGLAVYCLVSRKYERVMLVGAALVAAFVFLNFTTIGESNSVIRRARSAFNKNDESLKVRLDNQERLRKIMKDKPFGYGIGLSGGNAKNFGEQYYDISQIATDSWYVQIWVETGIVGLTFYFMIIGYLLARGMYIVRYKLKNDLVIGYETALLCGFTGLFVMSSNNQVLANFPNGVLAYTSIALLFLGPHYDKQMLENKDGFSNNGKL